ncbi:MAG TPA: DUF3592 domain-containing protein [Gammaproteobacteria bacterium]
MDDAMKWMVLLIFGGIGVAAFLGGSVWAYKRYTLYSNGAHTEGVVVKNFESVTSDGDSSQRSTSISYYPVVEFTAQNGVKVNFHGSTGSSVPDFEVGARVAVIYDPHNPSSAQIDDFSQMWLGPVAIVVVGVITLALATVVFIGMSAADNTSPQLARAMLSFKAEHGQSARIEGMIREVRALEGKETGKYVLVVTGLRPGGDSHEEFLSETFAFDPGRDLVGRSVTIFLDPYDPDIYQIDIAPLLPDIMARQSARRR